jgi:hypothetical protein
VAHLREPSIRPDGLQLEEYRPLQERFWTIQRWAWMIFSLVLVGALLGLTGSGGPLSRTTQALAGGSVEYPRIARWETPDLMEFTFHQGGNQTLTLSQAFSDAFQVQSIQPEPESSRLTDRGMVLQFDVGSAGAATVIMHVTPLRPGFVTFGTAIGPAELTQVSPVVLP